MNCSRQSRGSSPHARGTPIHPTAARRSERFIPACAGNACFMVTGRRWDAVHPRMRGERSGFGSRTPAGNGSSPHARGTRPVLPLIGAVKTVHPRMRGERLPAHRERQLRTGSSPHARGTHTTLHGFLLHTRFIPACAGNAWCDGARIACFSVHPRMRGERMRTISIDEFQNGSSPHARGTLRGRCGSVGRRRFIPACAGNACYHFGTHLV